MYKKILVPFDSSDPAKRALQAALDMGAGIDDAEITVLNVIDWHDYNAETFKIASRMAGISGDALDMNAINEINDEANNKETSRIAEEIAPIIGNAKNISIAIANGSPHDAIVAYADDLGFDCIVMGHRGMGMIRGMLGSVCYSVLAKATRPVLVVK